MVTKTYLVERPWALPAVLAPMSEARCILATDTPRLSPVHQVPTQAELGQSRVSVERQGISGLTGNGIRVGVKRMDVSGVPPRGRPV